MKIIKAVKNAQIIPRFYGVAWRDYYRDVAICMPMPLNLIAGVLHHCWLVMKHSTDNISTDPRKAYKDGVKAGRASAQTTPMAITSEVSATYPLWMVLQAVRNDLERANNHGVMNDTLWHSNCETLFDFIDAALEDHKPWGGRQS